MKKPWGPVCGMAVLLLASTALAQPSGAPPGAPPGTPPGSSPGAPPGGPPGGFPAFPGGGFRPPQPGQVLSDWLQSWLKLSAEQKKQLAKLQEDVDAGLAKILTAEQKKSLKDMRSGRGGFGPPGPGTGAAPGRPGAAGPGPGGFPGGFGAPRRDDMKKQLGATDEEWKVIGPKLQQFISARQVLAFESGRAGIGFGMSMRPNALMRAQTELKTVLDNPKHSSAEVKEKVAAARKAREQARRELETAQKDLLLLLTADQEAVLVSLGYLE